MNKAEFNKLLAKNMDATTAVADKTLKTVFDTICEAITQEDNLVFVGFGTFKTTISKARDVKTPTGKIAHVPEKRFVRFSPGSELKAKADTKNKTSSTKKAKKK